MKYFSYGPDGFTMHATQDEARAQAEGDLALERENAYHGWSDEVMYICWGEIREKARCHEEYLLSSVEDEA